MNKNYQNIKVTKLPHSEVEIEGEVTKEALDKAYDEALKKIIENADLDGFRKGKAPADLVLKKIGGEMVVLKDAADDALNTAYGDIVSGEKINAIGHPTVTITKIAKGNPLGFKIKTAVMPEVTLPDYKKIARSENSKKLERAEVTDKEVTEFINNIRKHRAHAAFHAKDEKEGHDPKHHVHHEDVPEKDWPALDDAFAKSLGDFKDVSDLKHKVRENMKQDKENSAREKKRLAIAEALTKETKTDLPEIIVESELSQMLAQFKGDVEHSGIKYEDYLKHVKKTEEDFRKEWREKAEKKAKLQFVLNKIVEEEKLSPTEEEIKVEMDKVLAVYKDANRFQVRMYVENFLANAKAFDWLENQKTIPLD